ncbi:hypothetical protein [Streptomyces sp. NPDC046727]|uniref:hypothetical protein n=1 Tax=Streptomyces sp. NPDC046727 TaxID=3155373 RepID=UPI0033C175EE
MLGYLPFLLVLALFIYSVGRLRRGPADGPTPSEEHRGTPEGWVAPDDNPEFLKSLDARNGKGGDGPQP